MLLTKLCQRVSDLELALDRKEIEMFKLRNFCSKKCEQFEHTIAEMSKLLTPKHTQEVDENNSVHTNTCGKRLSDLEEDFLDNNNCSDFENLEIGQQQQRKRRQIGENTFGWTDTPFLDPPLASSEPIPLDANIRHHQRTDCYEETSMEINQRTSKVHRPFIGENIRDKG